VALVAPAGSMAGSEELLMATAAGARARVEGLGELRELIVPTAVAVVVVVDFQAEAVEAEHLMAVRRVAVAVLRMETSEFFP
jgi:hypothetical protein